MSSGTSESLALVDIEVASRLLDVLEQRRSAKRFVPGLLGESTRAKLIRAIDHTPAAFNLPPWRIVLIEDSRDAFWDMFEAAVRSRLSKDRLDRHLQRIRDFRPASAIALVYEDKTVVAGIQDVMGISRSDAVSFGQQAMGMVQLAIWLALVEDGLSTSLQHWDWLAQPEIDEFTGADPAKLALVSVMPIGTPAEAPAPSDRFPVSDLVFAERIGPDS